MAPDCPRVSVARTLGRVFQRHTRVFELHQRTRQRERERERERERKGRWPGWVLIHDGGGGWLELLGRMRVTCGWLRPHRPTADSGKGRNGKRNVASQGERGEAV